MISKLFKEHKSEVDRLEQEFESTINKYSENEKLLKTALEETQARHDLVEKQKEKEA